MSIEDKDISGPCISGPCMMQLGILYNPVLSTYKESAGQILKLLWSTKSKRKKKEKNNQQQQ